MSQQSDPFLSSQLGSEDNPLFTPTTPSESQTCSNLELHLPPPVPSSLRRSTDRKKAWVIFDEMDKKAFLDWWFKTQFGSTEDIQRQIKWDGKKLNTELWSDFSHVAHYQTGEPKVMCNSCGNTLNHPNYQSTGTSTIKKHQASCKKAQLHGKRPNIQQLLQNAVFLLSILY